LFTSHQSSCFLALIIGSLGTGYYSAIRSFVTSLVEKDEVGLLYTVIGMIDSIGTLIATPLVTVAFAFGVRRGGLLMGLPFFIVGGLYLFSGIMTWRLEVGKGDKEDLEEERSLLREPSSNE
jgi:MFS-type transporter involved in bile tolerance (Atg22 family)